jgi:hypothetical protein
LRIDRAPVFEQHQKRTGELSQSHKQLKSTLGDKESQIETSPSKGEQNPLAAISR